MSVALHLITPGSFPYYSRVIAESSPFGLKLRTPQENRPHAEVRFPSAD